MPRNHTRHVVCVLLTILPFLAGPDAAQARDAPPIDPNDVTTFAEAFFAEYMQTIHVPGAVFVVVADGRIIFSQGYGYTNLEGQTPVTPDSTLFPVASISKLFTATAVMQLVEQGRLDLHADVNTYLTHFKIAATYPQPVTLAHLLTHTGGFDSRTTGASSRSPAEQPTLRDHLAARMPPRVRPPGTVIAYCSYGIGLAGYIVEVVSGLPFDQYARQHILQPLEMHRSSFQAPPDVTGDLVTGYWHQPPDGLRPAPVEYINVPPAGQLTATAADMANFIIAHLQDGRFQDTRILKEATARQMHQQQFAHHPDLPGWCYGFNEDFTNGHRTIGHAGGISGVVSFLLLVPDHQAGFFFSQNGGSGFLAPLLIDAFMDEFFPDTAPPTGPPVRTELAVPLETLAGRYRFTLYPHTTIAKLRLLREIPKLEVRVHRNGMLTVENIHSGHIKVPPGPYVEVAPFLFREVHGPGRLAFRHDQKERVTHLLTDAHWDAIAYERLSWYDHPTRHRRLVVFCVLVFLSACIFWPLAALIRRVRKIQGAPDPVAQKTRRRQRLARLSAGLTATLILLMLAALASCLYLAPPNLAHGQLGPIPFLLVIPLITTALTAPLFVFLILAWKDEYWTPLARLHYTLVVVAALAFIPFLWYWNLLGFHY